MKINQKELKEMVRKVISKKLNESSDFTAKRYILLQAQNASMEFEKEIVSQLNIVNPDQMPPNLQERYYQIAEEMKKDILAAVTQAVRNMSALPRNDAGGNGNEK